LGGDAKGEGGFTNECVRRSVEMVRRDLERSGMFFFFFVGGAGRVFVGGRRVRQWWRRLGG